MKEKDKDKEKKAKNERGDQRRRKKSQAYVKKLQNKYKGHSRISIRDIEE